MWKTCVIIPAYNSSRTIGPLVRHIRQLGFDAVVVNDGSTDDTAQVASEAGALVMSSLVNQGKGTALRRGFAFALRSGYEAIVTLDGDGQHDPQEIPRFLETAEHDQAMVVIGHRLVNGANMPPSRRWTNRLMSGIVSWLARQPIPDSQCGFRLIRRQALAAVELSTQRFEIETELLLAVARCGWTVASVPIRTIYSNHHSHIRPISDGVRFLRLVLRYVLKPRHQAGVPPLSS